MKKPMGRARVLVVGWDCAAPALVFDRYRDVMPNTQALMSRGMWGNLRSSVPPITVPAWACMTSGRDAGELGVYGFRDREAGSYELSLVDSSRIEAKRIWDFLGEHGRTSSVLFVPPSYPPQAHAHGEMVSCFLTPSSESDWAAPAQLKEELRAKYGEYLMDVDGVRGGDKQVLLHDLHAMTRQHFAVARHMWSTRNPDFMMMVEIGPDRLHHAMWNAMDPFHPRASTDPVLQQGARDYYALLDQELGALLALTDEDTTVLVVSDHGARSMQGGVCINEWLIQNGWLVLNERPTAVTPLRSSMVNWEKTRAWGEGGYYARVFLNVRGREPRGSIPSGQHAKVREELSAALQELRGKNGEVFDNLVVDPHAYYREARGNPPDLCVIFDQLAWRSIGSVGHGVVFAHDNDQGDDGCNHDWEGIFVMAGPHVENVGATSGLSLYDVTPTVLSLFDIPVPADLLGRDLTRGATRS